MSEDMKWDLPVRNHGSDLCYPSWLGKASSEQNSTSSFLLRSAYNVPRPPGPTLYFGAPPYSTYTNTGHCLHVLLLGDGSPPVARPLPLCMLWLALPCRCVTLQLHTYKLYVTSSLSSSSQPFITIPPACGFSSLFILFISVLFSCVILSFRWIWMYPIVVSKE